MERGVRASNVLFDEHGIGQVLQHGVPERDHAIDRDADRDRVVDDERIDVGELGRERSANRIRDVIRGAGVRDPIGFAAVTVAGTIAAPKSASTAIAASPTRTARNCEARRSSASTSP
jgi:hypothetical protein